MWRQEGGVLFSSSRGFIKSGHSLDTPTPGLDSINTDDLPR